MDYKITTYSEEETIELAQNIESEKFPNMVICLKGDLGTGKTLFTKGFAQASMEQIYKWNPARYYILSVYGIKENEKDEIESVVAEVEKKHGCQIIINGLLPTIKYYLRLITNLPEFISIYTEEVQNDTELQKVHKLKWQELIEKYQL